MAAGRDIEDTDSLRIAELFLVFIVISLLYGRFMHFLNHKLEGPAKRGLRHTVHHIEEELLALGVISLILIVAEVRVLTSLENTPALRVGLLDQDLRRRRGRLLLQEEEE